MVQTAAILRRLSAPSLMSTASIQAGYVRTVNHAHSTKYLVTPTTKTASQDVTPHVMLMEKIRMVMAASKPVGLPLKNRLP